MWHPPTESAPNDIRPATTDGPCRFAPAGLDISLDHVLRVQGYARPAKVRPAIRATAESVVLLATKIVTPTVHYRRRRIVEHGNDRLRLDDGAVFTCPAFDRHMADCVEVAIYVMTLGGGVDRIARNLIADEQLLEAVILEAAGWIAIEGTTRAFTHHLRAEAALRGLEPARRMSPGYGFRIKGTKAQWSLEEQKILFESLDSASLPVQLLESCAMIPKMSRSGLFGLRPRDAAANRPA